MKIAIAQIASIYLDRDATLKKVAKWIGDACHYSRPLIVDRRRQAAADFIDA